MFELFFPLTLAFLAYVAYDAYQAIRRAERGEPVFKVVAPPAARPAPAPAAKAAVPAPAREAVKPAAPKATPAKPAPAVKSAPSAEVTLADELRNPSTGEVSTVPANYRFAKKWIKDALVSEKLLDRVYKPNELDDATSRKVKEAIDKLRAIKKYQA